MVVETKYPLIDADPHASRVIRYFRPSDYAFWAGSTIAFPSLLYAWGSIKLYHVMPVLKNFLEMADPTHTRIKTPLKFGGLFGFLGGFMFAYQRSSSMCHCRDPLEICELLCA